MKAPRGVRVWTRVVMVVVVVGAFATIARAQGTPGPPSRPSVPPRDVQPAAAGTAIIRGRIVAGDTGRPLRRARIQLFARELGPEGQTTSTTPDGQYEFRDLPAGRYTLQASRSGYLRVNYGQRRPLEAGTPLQIADRQVVEHIDFALPRASVIAGMVTDETGDAVADAQVFAMRLTYQNGRRQMAPAGTPVRTDDAGQYRITGLSPGRYAVMAILRETWTVTERGVERTLGYAPTYFPGAAAPAGATLLTVGVGQEVRGTDVSLIPGQAATVSGIALDSHGRPLAGSRIMLSQEFVGDGFGGAMGVYTATAAADGTFTIRNVPPGEYTLRAPGYGQRASEGVALPIVLNGENVRDVMLRTSAGWSVVGDVIVENGELSDVARDQVRIGAPLLSPETRPMSGEANPENGRVKNDGTFTFTGIFGPARLTVPIVPTGWSLKRILLEDGREITDTPIEGQSGEQIAGVHIVLTHTVTTVAGQLLDNSRQPLTDATVIVFADDADKWSAASRWVRTVRPDQQGQYQIQGLPPGQYLAVALSYVENQAWTDPDYLASIRSDAQRFTLLEGGTQVLSLKIR